MKAYTTIHENVKGIDLVFMTSADVFSPKHIDKGTLAMLSAVEFYKTDKVLDLGCGYGVVGITAAKLIGPENVVMTDIDDSAVELAKINAGINDVDKIKILQSDCFTNLDDKDFSMILSNPPYHTDFSVAKTFIEKGFNRLCVGGKMIMVTRRKAWYKNKLTTIFGGTKISETDGYSVFIAVKKTRTYAKHSIRQLS